MRSMVFSTSQVITTTILVPPNACFAAKKRSSKLPSADARVEPAAWTIPSQGRACGATPCRTKRVVWQLA